MSTSKTAAPSLPGYKAFDWSDPFLFHDQLTEDERLISETARSFAEEQLLPTVNERYLDEKTDIGHFVTSQIQTLPGVKDTFTLITFKAFS